MLIPGTGIVSVEATGEIATNGCPEYAVTFKRPTFYSPVEMTRKMGIDATGWKAWRGGQSIQNALPMLSEDDREFLISGTTPEEWDAMFPEEE